MSGSRWMTIRAWLSRSLRLFLCSSSVHSCTSFESPLLLLGPPTVSVLYWDHLCMKCSLGICNFLEEIASLSCSISILFLCLVHLRRLYLPLLFSGILHSDVYIFPFLLCLSLLFFSQLFVRPPQTFILPSCIFFSWGWFWSLPQCLLFQTLTNARY